jgi:hypothetical protein
VLAAGLPDVGVRDSDPLVALGLELHLLDQAAVLLLDVGAVVQRAAGLRQPLREVVAELLELAERQDPRPAARADLPLEARAWIRRAEELRQLGLEPGDLLE